METDKPIRSYGTRFHVQLRKLKKRNVPIKDRKRDNLILDQYGNFSRNLEAMEKEVKMLKI